MGLLSNRLCSNSILSGGSPARAPQVWHGRFAKLEAWLVPFYQLFPGWPEGEHSTTAIRTALMYKLNLGNYDRTGSMTLEDGWGYREPGEGDAEWHGPFATLEELNEARHGAEEE